VGTVYLIHFETRLHHAGHYVGWTGRRLRLRLDKHAAGQGARLMEVIRDAGIGWRLARTWRGDRALERKIKRRHEAPRLCPICIGKRVRCAAYRSPGQDQDEKGS
jgi:predicted GIY-YIG superfamily endonuclease